MTSAPSEPDYLLTRIDGPSTRIAIFLDGYAFHASTGINRIADDAAKREALRAEGMQVWQFTHPDVMAWKAAVEGTAADRQVRTPAEPLLGEGALRAARQIHQMLTGGPRPDDTLDPVLRNPINAVAGVRRSRRGAVVPSSSSVGRRFRRGRRGAGAGRPAFGG